MLGVSRQSNAGEKVNDFPTAVRIQFDRNSLTVSQIELRDSEGAAESLWICRRGYRV